MEITQEELTAICQRIPGDAAVYRVMDNALETVYRSPGLYERNAMSELEYKYRTQKNAADLIQPGDLPAVWQAIDGVVVVLIGSIALEDAGGKIGGLKQ